MDHFKDYIQQNAEKLDIDEPRELVWDKIQQQMEPAPVVRPLFTYLRWAAAACIIALAGIALWKWPTHNTTTAYTEPVKVVPAIPATPADKPEQKENKEEETFVVNTPKPAKPGAVTKKKEQPVKASNIAEENAGGEDNVMLHNMEFGFAQVIDMKLDKIRKTPLLAVDAEYFDVFKKQFYQLDQDEKAVKKKMGIDGVNDESLEQLINIYQQKINVLKQLQNEINKTNKYRKQHQANVLPAYMNI
ncbi:MAG: hypothetical protein J0I41_10820 [Filimonas sp.]|nr:hypothetical protein [Filimonas sp.]